MTLFRRKKRKVLERLPQRGSSVRSVDRKRRALPPGRRVSASGRVYTETRANRSDKRKWL